MARVVYLDCFSGISGDMVLGACLDAGLPLAELRRALGSLGSEVADVSARRVLRCGITATKFDVPGEHAADEHASDTHEPHGHAPHDHAQHGHTQAATHGHGASSQHHVHGYHDHHDEPQRPAQASSDHGAHHHHESHAHGGDGHGDTHTHGASEGGHHHHHHHRSLAEIAALIDRSALSVEGRARAKQLFRRLAEVEAGIHQMSVEDVHLHEVGAIDSIVDIVGAVFAFEWLDADRVVCSPLNVGGGRVHAAHGLMPVPAPATVQLLGGAPIYSGAVQSELVTPTGALIATSYATSFGPLPAMSIERIGYGAGSRDHRGTPNVLRLLVGTSVEPGTAVSASGPVQSSEHALEPVVVLECEIDDMNPQIFGVVMEKLYAAGALDVYYVPVQMKKNRPGTLLTVLAPPELRAALSDIVFAETTTIGLRVRDAARERLPRDVVVVETPLGPVRVKRAWRRGQVVNAAPEFDDCVKLAALAGRSVKDVHALALQAYGAQAIAPDRAL